MVENIIGKRNKTLVTKIFSFAHNGLKCFFHNVVKSGHKDLTLSQTTHFKLFQTLKTLQTTISKLMKVAESSLKR